MLARGFTIEMLRAWFNRDAIGAARTKVAHLQITTAGRKAIAE
jgi:hypothetical protein